MSDDLTDAICRSPDDDALRLVFADRCEEHGDLARAELVRVQVALSGLVEWDERRVPLKVRERGLLRDHGSRWRAELPDIAGVDWRTRWSRGFLCAAAVRSFPRLVVASEALGRVPGLASITVPWPLRAEEARVLTGWPGLRELRFERASRDAEAASWLAAAPFLRTLRVLRLHDRFSVHPGHRALLGSPHLEGLEQLELVRPGVARSGVSALVHDAHLPHLCRLRLGDSGFARDGERLDVAALTELAAWPGLARVESLSLAQNALEGPELAALLASPHLGRLRRLDLSHLPNRVSIPLADAHESLRLHGLRLRGHAFGDSVAELVGGTALGELRESDLSHGHVQRPGTATALLGPLGHRLERLVASAPADALLDSLCEVRCPHLHTIDFASAANESWQALLATPSMRSVRSLRLGHSDRREGMLTHPTARALADSPHLGELRSLVVVGMTGPGQEIVSSSALGRRLAPSGGLELE